MTHSITKCSATLLHFAHSDIMKVDILRYNFCKYLTYLKVTQYNMDRDSFVFKRFISKYFSYVQIDWQLLFNISTMCISL